MKKLAFSVVAILILLIGGLLVLPSFWDWNGEKGRIAAEVRKLTGRDLKIVGDVNLQLLPAPAFAAREVSLANIDGAGNTEMIRIEELRIEVALFPLLRQQVVVETVTLVKPEVVLEVLPDGRRNWAFESLAQASADAADQPPGGEAAGADGNAGSGAAADDAVRVDSFVIEDGTLFYRDAVEGIEERLTQVNAELAAESLLGPFVASGSAAYEGIRGDFDLSLDRLRDRGATGFTLGLRLPDAEAGGQFTGALSRHEDLQTLRGRLRLEGAHLGRLVALLAPGGGAVELDGPLAQSFGFETEVTAGPETAEAAATTIRLGETSFEGEAQVALGAVPEITARLSTTRLDLDSLLPSAEGRRSPGNQGVRGGSGAVGPGTAEAPPVRPSGDGAAETHAFDLPGGIAANLDLSVDTLVYRGQFARDLRAKAQLRDAALSIENLTAALPGGSNIALDGNLRSVEQAPAFSGRLEATSDNLRALLSWLQVDIAEVPADRLRKMALKTTVDAGPRQVTLSDLDLRLDVSRMTGGIAVALRDRPGLGIGLAVDRINLDAYLPAAKQSAAPDGSAGEAAAPASDGAAGSNDQAADAASAASKELAFLADFDANLDLKVGALTYQGIPFNGLRLDATLQQGGLIVREASLADLAGSGGRFAGSLANVSRSPSFDGSLDLSVTSLSRLIKALGLPSQGQLPLEAFTLTGAVNGTPQLIRFDQNLSTLGGRLKAAGKADLSQGPPALEAALALTHGDLSTLLRELLPGEEVPGGLGGVDLKGQLTADPASLRLTALEGKAAGVDLAGALGLSLAGARPMITADLQTGPLPLAALAAPAAAAGGGKKAAAAPSNSRTAVRREERWSSKPIDLDALRSFDAQVTLQSSAVLLEKARLEKARVEAVLQDGLLDLKRFTATAYGGALSVIGKADARETAAGGLEVAAAVTAIEVNLKDLLRDLGDTDRFSGPISLESSLNAQGISEAALVGSLNGEGKIDGSVTVAAKVEEQAGAVLLGILGQKVKEVRGITDSTSLLFSAFAGTPAKIDGTFVVEQGILTTEDTRVRGRSAEALTAATVNLPTWQMNSQTDVFRDSDPENAYLTAKLRGSLDGPDVNINGQPFQRRQETPAADPASPVAPQGSSETPVERPKTVKPEDLLKEGLKGLLKGLGG